MIQKKIFFYMSIIMLSTSLPSPSNQLPPNPTTFQNHVHFYNLNEQGGQQMAASMRNSAMATNQVQIENKLTTDIKIMLQKILDKSTEKKDLFLGFCKNNRYKIVACALSGSYLYLLYTVLKCHSLMHSKDSWCCWRSDLETDELIDQPSRITCERLLRDIQATYLIQQKNIDFLDPFSEFIKVIKHEINSLTLYLKLYKIFETLRIKKIFFINNKTATQAEDKLERLYFLYNSFISWHTDRNIKQA